MGLTGQLAQVAVKTCPHCNKEYGKHSKKGFMRCLYTANYNLYNAIIENNKLKNEKIKVVDGEAEIITPEGSKKIKVPKGARIEMVDAPDFKEETNES